MHSMKKDLVAFVGLSYCFPKMTRKARAIFSHDCQNLARRFAYRRTFTTKRDIAHADIHLTIEERCTQAVVPL